MALTPDQVDDFVNLTLKLFKRNKWTDISLPLQEYVTASMLDAKRVTERGGEQISFRVKTKNTGNAKNSGLFAQDNTQVEDVTVAGNVPWAMQTTSFGYDIHENFFQSDRETIIRELQIREHDALSDFAELTEENLWSAPTGTTDTRPMGIPFWIQKDSTTTPAGGFEGGNPSGFTGGCAGISTTTYPRWDNWAFGYSNPTTDDLVARTKKALAFTRFMAPVPHPELAYGKVDYQIYTTYRTSEPLERLAETRNDNLGRDLAKYVNQVLLGGVPVKWVPYLEANDTTDPVYGVNWRVFRPFVKKGAHLLRHPPQKSAKQHTVREVHFDSWMNYICLNRRCTFVGSK